jgi:hypothetical protein
VSRAAWIDEIMPYVRDSSDPLGTWDLASHYLPLDQAARGYELFQKKGDGCTRVIFQPDRHMPEIVCGGRGAA